MAARTPEARSKVDEKNVLHKHDPNVKYDYFYTWYKVQTSLRNTEASGSGGKSKLDVAQTAPFPRSGHACFSVGASDSKLFIQGGAAGGEYYKDLWVLETKTKKWQSLHTYNSPSPRAYHQIVLVAPDPEATKERRQAVPRLVMFGGFNEGTLFSEVEVLGDFSVLTKGLPKAQFGRQKKKPDQPPDPETTTDVWRKIRTVGEPPMPRCNHTMSVIAGKMVVVIGGWHGAFTNDVYTLDVDTWTWKYRKTNLNENVKHGEFLPRAGHTATVLPGRRILVFGGQNGKHGQLADLWVLDTVTWEWNKPIPVGTPPTKRSGHSAAFNRQGHVYFFGGWDGIRMRSDLAILSVSGDEHVHWKWKKPVVSGADIPGRVSPAMALVGNMLWVFGGWSEDGFLDDTYALEIEHTPRDMEKDKLLKAKIKQGLGRMGEAAERAAFDRARARGVDPLAMMDPKAMTLQQIEEYHANVQSKIEEAANYLRAKDQEIHFVKDRKDRQEKRDKALETAYQHQIRFKQFLEMGATMEEAMGLANGFASPELKARFGVEGYAIIPPPPGAVRRQDLSQEQLEARIYGRGVYLGDGQGAGDDPVDAISRSGGLLLTWGEGSGLPDDLWGSTADNASVFASTSWSIGECDESEGGSESRAEWRGNGSSLSSSSSTDRRSTANTESSSFHIDQPAQFNDFSPQTLDDSGRPVIKMAKFTGELPLERTGDETVNHINPDMGPVLREVLRDQKRVQGLKRGNLKVPVPPRNPMRPTRIVEGLNVPQDLDDIIDPKRLLDQSTDQQFLPAPYDPTSLRVAQDVLDVTLQSKGGRYRSSSAAMSLIAQQASEMAISAEEQLPHSLLLLAATRGVEFERTVRAARGEPLPIPGVPYGETPNKPVPEAMQKIVAGMQKVAKGWMQKKEYKRQKAASRIQAFVRGRAARKEVDRMRAAAGLPPLQNKSIQRAVANQRRYETKRAKDLKISYARRVAGIAPAIRIIPNGPTMALQQQQQQQEQGGPTWF